MAANANLTAQCMTMTLIGYSALVVKEVVEDQLILSFLFALEVFTWPFAR